MGSVGSSGEKAGCILLSVYGPNYNPVNGKFMGESDGATALKDGKIDSMIITRPLNSAALMGLIILFVSFYNPALLIVDTIWSGA